MVIGSLAVAGAALVVALGILMKLVMTLSKTNVELANRSYENAELLHDLVSKQSALIASKDALAYQAIRAMDVHGGYDDDSTQSVDEETTGGDGSDTGFRPEDPGLEGDPFFQGTVI